MDDLKQRRSLSSGCARKTVSLPADIVKRVESYLEGPGGVGLTFSAFVSDSLKVTLDRIDQFNGKKKVR
jgi:pantothenate kinase type III